MANQGTGLAGPAVAAFGQTADMDTHRLKVKQTKLKYFVKTQREDKKLPLIVIAIPCWPFRRPWP